MALTKVGGDLLKQPLTIGTGVTISSDGINASGIITATSFVGDISQATGASAGLGTALSQDQSSPLNKIYYTDTILSVGSTITINPPDSSNIAYTQYAEISVDEGYDIIVEDGDDLIPDILGLSTTTAGPLSGAGGRVRADNFTNKAGTGAPTFPNGVNVTGVVTATSFSGNVTGNVTGDLTGNVTGDLTGNVTGDLTGNVVAGIITSSGISTFSDTVNVGAGKSIRLYGASSGYTEIVAAAGSASTTFTLPANGGSASQYLQTDGTGTLSWQTAGGITWLTTVDATSDSGNAKTITGIDTNSRMIVVSFYRVSIDAADTNPIYMRVGNGSINSGSNYYWGTSRGISADRVSSAATYYRLIVDDYNSASHTFSGNITLLRTKDASNPNWSITHSFSEEGGGNEPIYGAGSFTDTLIDRIQFVPNGNFDSGSIRIGYIL